MKRGEKIVLTIPSVLSLAFMFVFIFPSELKWFTPSMNVFYAEVAVVQLVTLTQVIFLLHQLWSFKKIERKIKVAWTWFLFLFTAISALVLIWSRFDTFDELNNRNVLVENN